MKTVPANIFFQSTLSISFAFILAVHHLTHLCLLRKSLHLPCPLALAILFDMVGVSMLSPGCSSDSSDITVVACLRDSVRRRGAMIKKSSKTLKLFLIIPPFCQSKHLLLLVGGTEQTLREGFQKEEIVHDFCL